MQALNREWFDFAYNVAKENGIEVTASVFDKSSLDFLLTYDVPFIKIACQTKKYAFRENTEALIKDIPQGKRVVLSVESDRIGLRDCRTLALLCCVPEYPAQENTYCERFSFEALSCGISDHTIGLDLYKRFKPAIFEKHFCLLNQPNLDYEWSVHEDNLKELFE